MDGLEHSAFSKDGELLRLAGVEESADLDLSHVSELKLGEKGLELKFFGRFRALELLSRLAREGEKGTGEEGISALASALNASARSLPSANPAYPATKTQGKP